MIALDPIKAVIGFFAMVGMLTLTIDYTPVLISMHSTGYTFENGKVTHSVEGRKIRGLPVVSDSGNGFYTDARGVTHETKFKIVKDECFYCSKAASLKIVAFGFWQWDLTNAKCANELYATLTHVNGKKFKITEIGPFAVPPEKQCGDLIETDMKEL